MNVPFGPWRPDSATLGSKFVLDARNVYPAAGGFRPVGQLASATAALAATPVGAVTMRNKANETRTFVGTATKLYRMNTASTFADATRASGGDYAVSAGDRWYFSTFGALALAVNGTDAPQKYDIDTASGAFKFEALGGTPPVAKYIATVADRVVLGNLVGYGNRIHWSGLADSEEWTVGTDGSDTQDFYAGGSVTGLVGGENGYVFQRTKVRRMTPTPGSDLIFQIDEVETERGCIAPGSIVEVGAKAFFLSSDGFYQLDKASGGTSSIDAEKIREWFRGSVRSGQEVYVIGSVDAKRRVVQWAYVSRDNSTDIPDKVLFYNWELQEWSRGEFSVACWVNAVGASYTLDSLDTVDVLDSLPYSLDSSFWTGSEGEPGVIGLDNTISTLSGAPMAARIETMDTNLPGNRNTYVSGVVPEIDTTSVTVALGVAPRHGDSVVWDTASGVEDTGECPQHVESRYIRARMDVSAGALWSLAQGLEAITGGAGAR